MNQLTSTQTLTAIRAIAGLNFQPITPAEAATYEGAPIDAVLASADAAILANLCHLDCVTGPHTLEVLIGGYGTVELHCLGFDDQPIALTLTLDRAI